MLPSPQVLWQNNPSRERVSARFPALNINQMRLDYMPTESNGVPNRRFQDLTGRKFERLLVLGFDHRYHRRSGTVLYWKCLCDCGQHCVVSGHAMRRKHTKSCGCYNNDVRATRFVTHGLSRTPLHKVWCAMKSRCFQKCNTGYPDYGGRGITVCEQWMDFKGFYDDMHGTYRDGLTLDRINVNGNYEPGNCRWATMGEQRLNTRRTKWITIDGIRIPLCEWCKMDGLSFDRIKSIVYSFGK